MKMLSLLTLSAMLSITACSHHGHHHKGEVKACCKEKKACCKEKKACCKPDAKKDCKDGHCPKPEAKKKAE